MKNKTIYLFFTAMAVIALPVAVFAIDPTLNPIGSISATGELPTTYSFDNIPNLIVNLVNWFAWFISVVAVAMGLYAGFLFMTARGETAQLATAKKTMLYAVIGIAVAIVSFSIIAITKIFL